MKVLSSEELGSLAYQLVNLVAKSRYHKEVKDRVHSRCRELYNFLYYSGCFSTFAFVYSKAGQEKVKEAFKWLTGSLENKEVIEPKGRSEDLGYAIYASFLCYLLKEMETDLKEGGLEEVVKIVTQKETSLIIENQMLEFARWLKRFAEALLR